MADEKSPAGAAVAMNAFHSLTVAIAAQLELYVAPFPMNIGAPGSGKMSPESAALSPPTAPDELTKPVRLLPNMNSRANV